MPRSDQEIQAESNRRIAKAVRAALPPAQRRGGEVADWEGADSKLIHQLVCAVATQNGAVRFGYTRDGGAYSIGLYLGDDSKTYYCNEKDGINEQLAELIEHFQK